MFRPNRYRRFRADERELLDAMVAVDQPGFDALRAQLFTASYKTAWYPGAASFDIQPGGGPRFPSPADVPADDRQVVRVQQVYRGGSLKTDENVIGAVFLWVADGYLSALEYQSTGDRAPASLPAPIQLGD